MNKTSPARNNVLIPFSASLPATYLIDTAGKVRFAHADADYRVRAEPQAVIDLLKTIQAR